MFTKRHYEFFAQFFAREIEVSQDGARADIIRGIARLLASEFERDNSKFSRDKFLARIGHGV